MTNAPSSDRLKLLGVIGVFLLALIGVGFLVLGVTLLMRANGAGSAVASPTRLAVASAQVVFVPTTTQSPPTATLAPTLAATPTTLPAASDTPAASAAAAHVVTIARPANVRSGPGLNYPTIGGLNVGQTAPALGRDSSAQWFAISFEGAPQGTGWVSGLVATYDGTVNDLPVVQAAAPPPQATAVPPTAVPPPADTAGPSASNTPAVQGSGGIQTLKFSMHKTTGSPNESLFFDFSVVNNSGSTITYGLLAAHTDQGVTAASWSAPLEPGKVLNWTDHINFPNTGTYQVYLGICYSSLNACKASGSPWTRLSNSVTVTIQ